MIKDENGSDETIIDTIKILVKRIDLGPGGRLVFFYHIPPKLATWLKKDARKRGYSLFMSGRVPNFNVQTKADADRAAEEHRREVEARDNWNNSPG